MRKSLEDNETVLCMRFRRWWTIIYAQYLGSRLPVMRLIWKTTDSTMFKTTVVISAKDLEDDDRYMPNNKKMTAV